MQNIGVRCFRTNASAAVCKKSLSSPLTTRTSNHPWTNISGRSHLNTQDTTDISSLSLKQDSPPPLLRKILLIVNHATSTTSSLTYIRIEVFLLAFLLQANAHTASNMPVNICAHKAYSVFAHTDRLTLTKTRPVLHVCQHDGRHTHHYCPSSSKREKVVGTGVA